MSTSSQTSESIASGAEYAYYLFLSHEEYRSAMIDWAVTALEAGIDGQAIKLLAGADLEEDREVVALFRKATHSLEISLPLPDAELDWQEQFICSALLNGRIPTSRGFSNLYRIWRDSEYSARFIRWGYLSESIALVEDGYKGIGGFESITL